MKKIITISIFFVCIFSLSVRAQGEYTGDERLLHFGFLLGFNTMDFRIQDSNVTDDGKHYLVDVSQLRPGFSVGIISDLKISRYFDFRFTPTLHLAERELVYKANDGSENKSIVVPSIPISFPFYIRYSAERYENIRPYIIGGGGFNIDLGRDKDKPVYLKPFDMFVEAGVGCDIYFSFFKLAPELKFAVGFSNVLTGLSERDAGVLNDADKFYSQSLSRLNSFMITLAFNFE
ncbi:MAG: PorT family protein [Paludibacter sp.]|jgi:hypothetical protein|nr:PorT family protein [Paludibacter sp.]